jgi:hypothetical protein
MINRRLALRTPLAAAIVIATLPPAGAAFASDHPNHSIEIVVPLGAGTDALARAFADTARKHLAQPFAINNKPKEVIGLLEAVAQKTMNEPQMPEAMDKLALVCACGAIVARKALIPKLNLKPSSQHAGRSPCTKSGQSLKYKSID